MFEKLTNSIYINGEWKTVNEQHTDTVYNPATLEPITKVADGGKEETEEAIRAAAEAFPFWSEMPGRKRSRILYKASELMREDAERLGKILTNEQGKPLKEAIGEVKGAAAFLLWYAEEAARGYGEWLPSSVKSKRMLVIPKPVGVVGAITPCGQCFYCLNAAHAQCGGALGGWRFGNTINGAWAEYLLVPHARANLAVVPAGLTDEQVLMLPDIASTGISGAESGSVRIGDSVAVFAQGPIGLCATLGAKLRGASVIVGVDPLASRRDEKSN